MLTPRLAAALSYGRRGWPVFPVKPGEKIPLLKNWPTQATIDEHQITAWWEELPEANIGIITGKRSNLVVLDIDPKHGGEESLEDLEDQHGKMPETVEVLTGSGGRHFYFQYPQNGATIRNSAGKLGSGLDIRGEGGYVVVPPSLHETGRTYEWESSSHPDVVPLAPLPDGLLVALQKSATTRHATKNSKGDPKIPEGNRNNYLTSLAGSMRRRGMGKAAIFAALRIENHDRCEPPLPDEEVIKIAESVVCYDTKPPPLNCPYQATPHGLVWLKKTKDGAVSVPLTNFKANIVMDVKEDDGAETRHFFELEACLNEKTFRFSIPAHKFSNMQWPLEHLGAQALVYPGITNKDHARAAIQMLSTEIQNRNVYQHTGWRKIDNVWLFLHGGGAIGPVGPVMEIEVSLPIALARYALPDPPSDSDLITAIRASLKLLEVVPPPLAFTLLGALYRSVLGGAVDFSLHLAGDTGTGKTELAALVQQHFGETFDARNLPASWSSTGNSLEALAFQAKDVVLTVDDFAPTGTQSDVQRYHREADRLLRAQGNRSGRQRLRPDATLKAAKYPRGLILSTGEDIPKGKSLRSRTFILEVGRRDMKWEVLTDCQSDARQGLYAQAMAGFIQWLAPQYEAIHQGLKENLNRFRDSVIQTSRHRRTPEIVANLALGLFYLLEFAKATQAISSAERDTLYERGWKAFEEVADQQGQHQAASDPTTQFFAFLNAGLASGKAHIADLTGDPPSQPKGQDEWTSPSAFGWRERTVGTGDFARTEWQAQGDRIGWTENQWLYLDPTAAFGVAQKMGQACGETIPVTERTLRKRFHERKLLFPESARPNHLTFRITTESKRREVLRILLSSLTPAKADQLPQSQRPGGSNPSRDTALEPLASEMDQDNSNSFDGFNGNGPVGPLMEEDEGVSQHPSQEGHEIGPLRPQDSVLVIEPDPNEEMIDLREHTND